MADKRSTDLARAMVLSPSETRQLVQGVGTFRPALDLSRERDTLRPYRDTPQDRLTKALLSVVGDTRRNADLVGRYTGSEGVGNTRMGVVDLLPGIGTALQLDEAGVDMTGGHPLAGTLMAGAALVPGSGKAAKIAAAALKGAGKKAIKAIAPQAVEEAAPAAQRVATAMVNGGKRAPRGIINTPNIREMSWDDALSAARGQPHLIAPKEGAAEGTRYIGAPPEVVSPEALGGMRARVDDTLSRGAEGGIPRWWYDTERDFTRQIAGPDPSRQSFFARGLGHFSPQSNPRDNLNTWLQAVNSERAGLRRPKVRNSERASSFYAAYDADNPLLLSSGEKVDPYARNFDPTTPPPPVGANDRHHARIFGYPQEQGAGGINLSPSQHRFLDYETVLAADRANAARLGGREDWTGPRVQETMWIEEKARRLMEQRPNLTYDEALGIARGGYAENANDFTVSLVGEQIPYGKAGFDLGDMTFDQKAAFTRAGSWTDNEGRDKLSQSFGFPTRPSEFGAGYWKPDGAPAEVNPVEVHRPMAAWDSFPINEREAAKGTGFSGRTMAPADYNAFSYLQGVRGLMDVQAGEPFHAMATQNSLKNFGVKNDPRTSFRVEFGGQPDEAQMRALNSADLPLDVWNASGGVTLRNWGDTAPALDDVEARVRAIIPDARVTRAAPSIPLSPNVDEFGATGAQGNYLDLQSELERPGEGLAVTKTLDREQALAPADQARVNDPNSEFNRTLMDAALDRSQRIADYGQQGKREDYELLYRLLGEGGIPRLKQWMTENGPKGLPVFLAAMSLPALAPHLAPEE